MLIKQVVPQREQRFQQAAYAPADLQTLWAVRPRDLRLTAAASAGAQLGASLLLAYQDARRLLQQSLPQTEGCDFAAHQAPRGQQWSSAMRRLLILQLDHALQPVQGWQLIAGARRALPAACMRASGARRGARAHGQALPG